VAGIRWLKRYQEKFDRWYGKTGGDEFK